MSPGVGSDREGRRFSNYLVPRGVSRHKHTNPKLYKKDKEQVTRLIVDNVDRLLGTYVFDDLDDDTSDEDADSVEVSTVPWIKLAIVGTMVAGLNVVFSQLLLGLSDPPNLLGKPIRKRSGRSLAELMPGKGWERYAKSS